jgi:hypothetical protein
MLSNRFEINSSEESDESMDDSNTVTRKRKSRELDEPENNVDEANQDFDIKQLAEELESELLPEVEYSDTVEPSQAEEIFSEPALKKLKQEKIRSDANKHGFNSGFCRIEKTNNPLDVISVPKKYVKEGDKRDFRLGYKEGYESMNKTLAEDESIFYAHGLEAGKKYALKSYSFHRQFYTTLYTGQYKKIYGPNAQTRLNQSYQQGYNFGYHHYCDLMDNYYQNYLQAYGAVIKGKSSEVTTVKSSQEIQLTPKQLECIKLQAIAGHEEGIELANLMIRNHDQKNHLTFFKLQIQRLTKLYHEGNVHWPRQRLFIAKLHPKAWENRGYILRNYFCPKQVNAVRKAIQQSYLNAYSTTNQIEYDYVCKEEAISHFIFFQLLSPYQLQLELDNEAGKIILNDHAHTALTDLRSVDSLAKSVRWDDKIFLENFLRSITKSPSNQTEEKLRIGPHKKYTVFGHGVFERSQKPSPYNLSPAALYEKKKKTSLPQATSLISRRQRIFGHANRRNKLVGYIFKPPKNLINRIFFMDMGTVNRPYEFNDLKEAEDYFNRRVNSTRPTMFRTLSDLKKYIANDSKFHNEVLARLKWNINTSCVAIFSDTFEARCIAQFYARLTYQRLVSQYRDLNRRLPQDYQVPIVFYLPEQQVDNWQVYSVEQQSNDKIKAEEISADETKIKQAFEQNNFEFLLLLDDLENLVYQDLSLLVWVAHFSLKIAKILYEQTNLSFEFPFEKYLNDRMYQFWHFQKNSLKVVQRKFLFNMALKFKLDDLLVEIVCARVIDECHLPDESLFKLVEANKIDVLRKIFEKRNSFIHQVNRLDQTLLEVAILGNQIDLVKLLLERRVCISTVGKNDPLGVCVSKNFDNGEILRLLLNYLNQDRYFASDPDWLKRVIEKAIFFGSKFSLHELVRFNYSLAQAADPVRKSVCLSIPRCVFLQIACNGFQGDSKECLEILLAAGADINEPDPNDGKTPLFTARELGLSDVVREMEASASTRGLTK